MRKLYIAFIILISLCVCSSALAQALTIPAQPLGYVNDYAHMLTRTEAQTINQQLRQFDRKTSNQVVVATFNNLGGTPLDAFSLNVATKWKIGSKKYDNGVLLLIIKNDRKIRIEVGYGLEGSLTDALSGIIIRHEIAPAFKSGNYYQGIENGVQAIMRATQGQYKPPAKSHVDFWFSWIVFFVIIGLFILSAFVRNSSYFIGTPIGGFLAGLGLGASSSGSGDDGFGGGFSGGGGGFGGGGASGGW